MYDEAGLDRSYLKEVGACSSITDTANIYNIYNSLAMSLTVSFSKCAEFKVRVRTFKHI